MKNTVRQNLRIILAIAAKDINDALKNRTSLGIIVSTLLLIIFFRFLPTLENSGALPRMAIYDAGKSQLKAQLENSPQFDLFVTDSQDSMETYLGDKDIPVLGLALPLDFERRAAYEDELEVEGYFVHWVNTAARAETVSFFEELISKIVDKPVTILTEGNTIYPQKDSRGMAFMQSSMMVIVIMLIGMTLAPQLMIEEKRTKTLDVMLVSPASHGQMVLGKALAGLFFCMIAIAIIFAFNTALIVHWEVALLTAVAGALFSVAVGLLLGSLLVNKQQMTFWTWVLFVPLIFPIFFIIATNLFPAGFLAVIQWLPTVAMSEAFRVSFSEAAPLSAYAPEIVIILVSVAVLLVSVERVVRRVTE